MDMRCGAEAIAFLSPGAMARDKREGYSADARCRSHENVFHIQCLEFDTQQGKENSAQSDVRLFLIEVQVILTEPHA
jgi:hypothetical protein